MAKAIMIQGTMSNSGKSLVAAGLCRIFKQDGYKVAPFKSQNMALNSFITCDGLEMGRAQVMQAEAAGIDPSVHMNPILLKPTDDTSSQVIVNGEVMDNMSAREYYKRKQELIPKIKEAYDILDKEYDIIVLEGAGSPAEINLKENDVVNMFMAKLVKAPVLLVGDIDRGGVFASLVGTMTLFDESERDLVKGVLINKFRGDKQILQPGLDELSSLINTQVVGVIPYMHLDIDDEDSLSERFTNKPSQGIIDIAAIRLPRISNFTDLNVFESVPGVSVRYVDSAGALGDPDLVIIPGTKNTMADLLWMRQNGLENAILKYAAKDKPVFGICGGYQMLGKSLKDPLGVEHGGELAGMGLLPSETIFEEEKVRTRVNGKFRNVSGIFAGLTGLHFEGYEIHMGTSRLDENKMLSDIGVTSGGTKPDGQSHGNVYGSYVHGIFDDEKVVKTILEGLLAEKGLGDQRIETMDFKGYKEMQYDLLADGMRRNIEMKEIYKILDEGVSYEK